MRKVATNGIYDLAKRDPRVVFVGSDLRSGLLDEMRETMPDRFYMEGVSEAILIGMAAGLAFEGYMPFVNTIATFLTRRCLEQVAIDVALHKLPVRLLGSGGGTVYAPLGPTHMAIEDIALLRTMPNMTIVAPCDAPEMQRAMDASLDWDGPIYLRIAKGGDPVVSRPDLPFEFGRAIELRKGRDVMFMGTGVATTQALEAAELLAKDGIDAGVLHFHTVKPLDVAAITAAARAAQLIVSVEEHTRIGGLGSAIAETFVDEGIITPLVRAGLPDQYWHEYGNQDHIMRLAGLLGPQLAATVRSRLRPRRVAISA
ncbi:MAG: transketolase C-terminal domain-containing protein [Vulcanimicrobiaceae bacterium]|jgi:transketolase